MTARTELAEELAGAVVCNGGKGCLIIGSATRPVVGYSMARWLSDEAARALEFAAGVLGFGELGWQSVVDAIVAGCWPDLLSEAIELAHNELETVPIEIVAIGG